MTESSEKGFRHYFRKIFSGSIAVGLDTAGQKLLGIILLPIFAIYLSPEDFGIITIVTMIVSMLSLVYNPGVVSALTRLYYDTEDEELKRNYFSSAFYYFLLIPIPFIVVALVWGESIFGVIYKDFDFYPYGVMAIALSFFAQPKRVWRMYMVVKGRMRKLSWISFISFTAGAIVAVILVVVLEWGVIGRLEGMFVAPIILFFVGLFMLPLKRPSLNDFQYIRKILAFGIPLSGAIWAYVILEYISVYLIERFLSIGEVGIFNIAYKMAGVPLFITLGFRQMWNPVYYENRNANNYGVIRKLFTVYLMVLTLITGFLVLFSKELIILLFDERYIHAVPLIHWIIIGVFFSSLLPFINSFLGYEKKFGKVSIIAMIAAGLSIILHYFMIKNIGLMGAAWSFTLSYFGFLAIGSLFVGQEVVRLVKGRSKWFALLLLVPTMIIAEFQTHDIFVLNELLVKIGVAAVWVALVFLFKLVKFSDIISFVRHETKKIK